MRATSRTTTTRWLFVMLLFATIVDAQNEDDGGSGRDESDEM